MKVTHIMADVEIAEVTNNGRCIKESSCKRTGIQRSEQPILTKYVLDIIRKKQWKKLPDASTVKMQNVCRDVRYPSISLAFIHEVKEGNFEEAYQSHFRVQLHFLQSVAVYARRRASVKENVSAVSKAKPVSIGKLERFVADWARENGIQSGGSGRKERQESSCYRFRSFRTDLCR